MVPIYTKGTITEQKHDVSTILSLLPGTEKVFLTLEANCHKAKEEHKSALKWCFGNDFLISLCSSTAFEIQRHAPRYATAESKALGGWSSGSVSACG